MIDRFKCNMSGGSIRLDGNDRLRRDLPLDRIVERSNGNIPEHQQNGGDFARSLKRPCFGLFLQTRYAAKVAGSHSPRNGPHRPEADVVLLIRCPGAPHIRSRRYPSVTQ